MPDWRFAAAALGFVFASTVFGATTMDLGRSYGYVVGDIVTQRVTFDHQHGRIDPASLPKPGYQTHWLYLRSADLSGPESEQQLTLQYQIMSSADDITLIYLPVVKLKTDRGDERIDAVPVTVSALTSKKPMQVLGMGDLQADQLMPAADTRVASRYLWLALPLLLLVGVGLLLRSVWLKRAGLALPFAHARRQIRKLKRADASDQQLREAYQQLHRAFDASAGRRVFAEGIDDFVSNAPAYQTVREDIADFFEASSRLFFGRTDSQSGGQSGKTDIASVARLSERLAGIERSSL